MSTRDQEDDQIRWENRKEDANYARTQAQHQSKIAEGFSHNTDALYALYGYPRAQPIYQPDTRPRFVTKCCAEGIGS